MGASPSLVTAQPDLHTSLPTYVPTDERTDRYTMNLEQMRVEARSFKAVSDWLEVNPTNRSSEIELESNSNKRNNHKSTTKSCFIVSRKERADGTSRLVFGYQVDGSSDLNTKLTEQYEISGFPTIKLFRSPQLLTHSILDTHTHALMIILHYTCCYDEIKGTQGLKFCSHAASLILSHLILESSVEVAHCLSAIKRLQIPSLNRFFRAGRFLDRNEGYV